MASYPSFTCFKLPLKPAFLSARSIKKASSGESSANSTFGHLLMRWNKTSSNVGWARKKSSDFLEGKLSRRSKEPSVSLAVPEEMFAKPEDVRDDISLQASSVFLAIG